MAEEEGVKLAAHPDDPPVPVLRQTPRLVYQPQLYQRLIDMRSSPSTGLEFCLGSIAEMTEGDVWYQATEEIQSTRQGFLRAFSQRNRQLSHAIEEVFVDEGDIDMVRILRILRDNSFDGVLIPDHTPQMHLPRHLGTTGMAFAMKAIREVGHWHGDERMSSIGYVSDHSTDAIAARTPISICSKGREGLWSHPISMASAA